VAKEAFLPELRAGCPILARLLAQGWDSTNLKPLDFDFLRSTGDLGRARVLLVPQIVRDDTALQRLSCASDFVMLERIKTPRN